MNAPGLGGDHRPVCEYYPGGYKLILLSTDSWGVGCSGAGPPPSHVGSITPHVHSFVLFKLLPTPL